MSIAFSAEILTADNSVVENVFKNPIMLANERHGEARFPAGRLGLIANYRAYNTSGKGRKARGAGGAVLDLSAVSRIPASELELLISKLEELQSGLDSGIERANSL